MKTTIFFLGMSAALAAQTHVNGGRTIEGPVNFCADSGSTDAYACSLSPSIAAYVTGAIYHFRANTANSGDASVNFNGLGARTIRKNRDQTLADSDIKAGQLVAVMYDGAEMQMLSQTGNAAAGGGGSTPTVISTAGAGYWSPFGPGAGTFITPNLADRDVRLWQVVLPYRATFGKVTVNVITASGTACPSGTCGLLVGIYNSACSSLLAWGRATSGGAPDIATTGIKGIPLSSAVTLDPGVYFLAVSSDSGFLAITARDIHGIFGAAVNSGAPRIGVGANRSTGNGAGLTFPAACGALNVSGFQMPPVNVWER